MYLSLFLLTLCTLFSAPVDAKQCKSSRTTTTSTTKSTPSGYATSSPKSCASGRFKIQLTMATNEVLYFFDYASGPTFVSTTINATEAGVYTLSGSKLKREAIPGLVYTISGFGPGPNPPPNGRALYEGVPGTFPSDAGESLPISVAVKDQASCSLSLTDGVRTVVGVAGFRGGPGIYLALPGTTSNFQEALAVKAIPA